MEPSSRSVQRTQCPSVPQSSTTIPPLTLLKPLFLTISGSMMTVTVTPESLPQELHALGDRAHEEMVGTRVPSARCGILVGDGFAMSRSPCYASCNRCVACCAVKFS